MQFVVPFAILTALFLVVAALERVHRLQFRPSALLRPHIGTDALWYLVAGGAAALSTYVFRPVLSHLAIAPLQIGVAAMPAALRLAIAVTIFDFVAFAVHLAIHRSDALWSVHKVHHSSLHLDWLATTRTHMFEHLVRNIPAQAVLFAFGFTSPTISGAILVYALFAVVGHSNLDLDLSVLELIFITPRLHRRHHVPDTTQHNFGTILSIWDRMFKRLLIADTQPDEHFGVPGQVHSYPQRFPDAARQPLRENLARARSLHRSSPIDDAVSPVTVLGE